MKTKVWFWLFLLVFFFGRGTGSQAQVSEETDHDSFEKWLKEDVVYLISGEEKEVFRKLLTGAEKERFIEQFWLRRDPEPRTPGNEFREEHYRRLAYANERFQSGVSGWRTDRGRIYIIHGAPDEIIAYPSGGRYSRALHEGGGTTSTYPFEVWRYRRIEGIGEDVELEFVDSGWAGEYRLSVDPDQKDALLRVPGLGPTRSEKLGLSRKMDRPFFQPGMTGLDPLAPQRTGDSPFARYEQAIRVRRPPQILFQDLREMVRTEVSYSQLDFDVRTDAFKLDERKVLVPVTVEIRTRDLTFRETPAGKLAPVSVYGSIATPSRQMVEEFEASLSVTGPGDPEGETGGGWSAFQQRVILEQGGPYKLTLVIRDENSGAVGVATRGITLQGFDTKRLSSSSVVLSDLIVPAQAVPPGDDGMFVLGDLKVRPRVGNRFLRQNPLGVYLQLYNAGLDAASGMPSLQIRYAISRKGVPVLELEGSRGQGLGVYPDHRLVLVKTLPVELLEPGGYLLEIRVRDRILGESLLLHQEFDLSDAFGEEAQGASRERIFSR